MSVIIAAAPNKNRSDILWAQHAQTEADEKIIIYDEIIRLLKEFDNPHGITLSLSRDAFDEEILIAYYDEDAVLEYKIMDGEHGR